ncbi:MULTISPECIES: TadE/TadG family type IV pilus assembly protein [Rhizobiaceae]|jgi:Flp pilus assembly protein TadG|uniref:Flp pilus assembly protein TadG n=1 Tax=Aliirhizobium cellulosilyticum TaxID=393664 RepID=A0A7W6WQ35_9HYPH|nr:TadE/TadG family type IV pilus assembly protein [Rhizobium cellulosilyticum]MBB4349023.1 Flp pilus assembly protein TadG [Rhizobium cellulosilyticum]MBB4412756.1 Flp pilus assembly protein TadG [Rhizobium cellulosilyticum]MBB4447388.1 Flp pilus assembly protein TadG [Rhizobium cellulosilyticum]
MRAKLQNILSRLPLTEQMRRFATDVRGIGGVEFALIAPLLLFLYITSFELTIGLSVSKRVTRTASTVADLVTQQAKVTTSDLQQMTSVANAIFTPYQPQNLKMKITGVTIDASSNPTVAWSWAQDGSRPYSNGSAVNVPTDMRSASTFLVRAEVSVTHQLLMFMPGLMPSSLQTITLNREFYYRQRVGTSITCDGC